MRVEGSFVTRAFGALLVSLVVAIPLAAQTPSAEQLQIFQNLTPEQQQAVLDRMAAGGTEVNGQDAASGTAAGTETERTARAATKVEPPVPTLAGTDTVMLQVSVPQDVPAADKPRLDALQALLLSRNPYDLNRSAQLNLPGFAPIALGGLTSDQATQRLALEPALAGLAIKLTRLPVEKIGAAGLKRFGYDLFDNLPASFSPVTNVPVPADYVVGPGDEFNVQLFGNQSVNRRLTVSRDGTISFPELGPITVGGLPSR
jgi:hypothetical protein